MPIAIVGMACRLPGGATSPSKLWKLLAEGRSAWSTLDKSRFRSEAWYHPSKGHIGTVSGSSVAITTLLYNQIDVLNHLVQRPGRAFPG